MDYFESLFFYLFHIDCKWSIQGLLHFYFFLIFTIHTANALAKGMVGDDSHRFLSFSLAIVDI